MPTELTVYDDPHHPNAADDRWIDFTDALEISGRTLTGTVTDTEYTVDSENGTTLTPSNDLTVTAALNTSAITRTNGETIAANHAVVLNIDGGTDGTWYNLEISVATSSGETLVVNYRFKCSKT